MNRAFTEGKTMNRFRLCTITAIMLFGLLSSSYAQEPVSDDDIIAGARALGMGGAQIAAVNDITAVVHNPAALARLNKLEIQLGLNTFKTNLETDLRSSTQNGSGSISDNLTAQGTIGIAYPVPTDRGNLVFALAYNRVKDFTGTFRNDLYDEYAFQTETEDWDGYVTEESIEKGGLKVISLAGAVDVAPNVSIGASVDIWTGRYQIDKRFLRNNYEGVDGVENTGDEESWLDVLGGEDNISAWSFKPSVLYFKKNFRFGAFMRLPMTFHIDQDNYEKYYTSNTGYFFNIHESSQPDTSDYYGFSYEIKAPMQLGFGLSLGQPGNRCLALDMLYENWKEAEDVDFPYYFRDKYRPTLTWRVGAEHYIPVLNIVGRVGYLRQPVNFKGPREDFYGAPGIDVENERDYVTFGIGKNFDDNFQLDIGYIHGFWRLKEGYRQDKETHNRIYASVTYRVPVILKSE